MTPEEIRLLRSNLHCTARELATCLGIPLAEVQAWEAGERFPTKRWVIRMAQLAEKGPAAFKRTPPERTEPLLTTMEQLDNPELWLILRKLIVHPKLFAEVSNLAAAYVDPAADED